jgi:glyoxylase-like metal-dependent hydrolase (beta-lactamase superfamily II)
MARITRNIHSIDGLAHPFGIGNVPCVVEERGPRDLTLIDTCLLAEEPKLEAKLQDEGYEMKDIKRLVLTHTHPDHVQAVNQVKKGLEIKVYSHWAEAGFLRGEPAYHGPPSHESILNTLQRVGISMDEVAKRFGSLERPPVVVDRTLQDGDSVGRLKVIHTPGHTPGHIALYSEEDRTVVGGDFLFNSVLGIDGLYVMGSDFSIDPRVAAVSARRVSQLNFDKLVLGHQREPLVEGARRAVELAADAALEKK